MEGVLGKCPLPKFYVHKILYNTFLKVFIFTLGTSWVGILTHFETRKTTYSVQTSRKSGRDLMFLRAGIFAWRILVTQNTIWIIDFWFNKNSLVAFSVTDICFWRARLVSTSFTKITGQVNCDFFWLKLLFYSLKKTGEANNYFRESEYVL